MQSTNALNLAMLGEPRFNGAGFIKVYLNPATRLHIWSPKFPPTIGNSRIHDHKFDYTSQILIGKMRHQEWVTKTSEYPTHQIFETFCSTTKRGNPPQLVSSYRCRINMVRESIYCPGDSYFFGAPNYYHEIICDEFTVAVMTRKKEYHWHMPRVIVPIGEEPDHAFDTSKHPSVEDMKETVNQALEMLKL